MKLLMKRSVMAVGVAFLLTPGTARAAFLFWAATSVKTASVKDCLSFGETAMRGLNFQGIRKTQVEISGTSGSAYAAITCVGTVPNATAIIMVVSDRTDEASRTRDTLRTKIAGIIHFD